MGFGLLVIGYFLLINVPFHGVDLPPDFLGYILIFAALTKLGKYEKKLDTAKYITLPLMLFSGGKLFLSLLAALGYGTYDMILSVIGYILAVILLVFYFFLLLGIRTLAKRVKLEKNARKSTRNLVIIVIFYVFTVYVNLCMHGVLPEISGVRPGAMLAIQQLFGYLIRFLNLIQFMSCYMWICLEGDEDMERKNALVSAIDKLLKREGK